MELFDKRFVHFMYSGELKGKKGFFADSIKVLEFTVNHNDGAVKTVSDTYEKVFIDESKTVWKFFYYDPLYEYKWAYKQGKKVQFKAHLSGWIDMKKGDPWDYNCKYRIKEEKKQLTHKQLAMWLAKGNGQAMSEASNCVYTDNYYNPDYEDDIIPDHWKVRKWEDTEWHEPTVDYCFPEEKG